MCDKYNVIVFGAGKRGRQHIEMLKRHPKISRVSVFDPNLKIPTSLATDVLRTAPTNDDLNQYDFAIVATPTVHHHEITQRLADLKIPCLVEKPLAATLSEYESICKKINRNPVPIAVGMIERFNPALVFAKDILESNKWDKLVFSRLNPASARLSQDSIVRDLMVHDIDLAFNFLGESQMMIETVESAKSRKNSYDYVSVKSKGRKYKHLEFCASRLPGPAIRLIEAYGKSEVLVVDLLRKSLHHYSYVNENNHLDLNNTYGSDALLSQFDHFIEYKKGETNVHVATIKEMKNVQTLVEKIENALEQ